MVNEEEKEEEELQDSSNLDLGTEWDKFPRSWMRSNQFLDYLRTIVSDPDEIDDIKFCDDCECPEWGGDLFSAGNDATVCGSCDSDRSACASCDERFRPRDLTATLSESEVCESCRIDHYSWCENCDGYYHDGDDSHTHGNSGCCESPETVFAVRNDGEGPLANDTRATITLPEGIISSDGLRAIKYYLQDKGLYDVSYQLEDIGDKWQAKDGNYAKRLSRLAWQKFQAKLTPEIMSQVGCIARDHSKPVDVSIEVTRDLNQDDSYFYHEGSCWWNSYSESRCALKTNGGFGMRSFDGDTVSGRAWVMPLKQDLAGKLDPTFETMTPDAFVVFNGYGDLSGYAAARILSHMAGWTYRKIEFQCFPMYINSGGYLIAREEIAGEYTDGALSLSVSQHSGLYNIERVPVNA